MRATLRYVVAIVLGVLIGVGFAIHTVRAGALGSNVTIGSWVTGLDFGTKGASPRTRAVVALRGLLALPAKEARYYTAATDDAGQALDGHCRYRVTGGALPGRWWSLTLYDRDGYLVPNAANRFSVESASVGRDRAQGPQAAAMAAIMAAEQRWTVFVSPDPPPGGAGANWLPTGGIDRFELTLRLYLPADGGKSNLPRRLVPNIAKEGC